MTVDFDTHYKRVLEAAERRVPAICAHQITESWFPDPGGAGGCDVRAGADIRAGLVERIDTGGIYSSQEGLVHPAHAGGALLSVTSVYACRDSTLFASEDLLERMKLLVDYLERIQRPDGTFDLLASNFYSSPDTGFVMHNLGSVWDILQRYGDEKSIRALQPPLYRVIERAVEGMVGGGFHTPNHRWVLAAALMVAYRITGNEACRNEAQAYLAEGIDIDENGEFTERSAGIYNVVNDTSLFMLSDELERPDLADAARRNLEMMFAYLEPDGSIFTWNSRRQDKGEGGAGEKFYPGRYYDLYARAALQFRDPKLAWMADSIVKSTIEPPGSLASFLLTSGLRNATLQAEPPGFNFDRHFTGSNIVRIRRGELSITILAGSSSFLFVQLGGLRCRMKLCASFFAVAQFVADRLEKTGDRYRLRFTTSADYRLPFDTPPGSARWDEMDHSTRRRVKELTLEFTVDIVEVERGIELAISVTGCDRVPFKAEMLFTAGAVITGAGFTLAGREGTGITAGSLSEEGSFVDVRLGSEALTVGPAFARHRYTSTMRGSDPPGDDEATLYFTDYTPVNRTIRITRNIPSGVR